MKVSDEVWEIAQDLYDDADFDINRYGELESFAVMDFEDYNGYYRDCKKSDYEKAKQYLDELLTAVKYYDGKLVLSDNDTLNDIPYDDIPEEGKNYNEDNFWEIQSFVYDKALQGLQEEIGTEVYGLGRSGKHICVDDTFKNLTKLDEYKTAHEKWEQWFIDEMVKELSYTDGEITESLNSDEKVAKCVSCGMKIKYKNRDVQHDVAGDYLECPNCHSTFDVDYDNIEPLLHKKTEAEDMSKVKDDIKDAVEKSDSTDLEKDQVKGSIDVLKTDEESAIEGYEDFKGETEKVADKELADAVNDQMEEIVDDEKEHIEKLDTIKSALGEGLELDDEETKFINAMVTRSKSDIEDFLGYDLTSKQFKDKQGLRLAIKEIYEQMPDEEFNKFKSALGESKEAPRLTGDETYVARNSSGYKSIGLIVNNETKQFQIINGQVMTTDSKTKKMSKKQIRAKAQQLYDNGYTEYDGYGSVAQGVEKKTEAEEKLYLDGKLFDKLEKATKLDFSNADIDILKLMYKRLDDLVVNIYDNRNVDDIETDIKNILSKANVIVVKLPIITTMNEAFNLAQVVRHIVGSNLEETFGYDFYYESKKVKKENKQNITEDTTSSEFNLYIKPEELADVNISSLLFDSDTTIASYREGNYELSLIVRGSVKIWDNENGYCYKNYQSFPVDLQSLIRSGALKSGDDTNKYTVDMSNWFEWFLDVADSGDVVDNVWNDVADIEGMLNKATPEENETELEVIMKDLFDDIVGQLDEGKVMKKENAPLNESDSLDSDPKFYEYVKSLLDAGSIDDPKYYNSLSDKEKENLIRNTWMKDADIINYYKNEIQLKTETNNKFKANVALHNLGINNASKLMQDLDTALENNDETKIKSIVKKLKNSLSSNDYKSFIKTYYPEYKDVLEKIESKKVKVEVKNMNDIIDRLYSGDKVYFKDTTGYFAGINQYYVCEKSLDYPKDPNDYDEGYTSGWNIGDDTAYDKEQERKYQRAKKASEDGDVWEFDEVDENGEYVGVVATICYGKDELQYVLDDANLTPVNQVKKFTEKMGKDADKKYSNLYKYKGKAFAYDNENAIVEYVYVDPEDNSWIVLDEIGLSNDNWDNKEARDEYLDEYIAQLDDEANRLADDFVANEYLGESLSSRYIKTEANGGTDTLDANSDLLPIINMYQYDVYHYCDDLVPPPDADMSKDVDEVMLDIAKPMIEEEIKGVLPSAKITFKEYKHPKYYKLFSNLNDVLYFDITYNVAEYEALKEKAVKDPEFEQYLKDHYKSYDGFMSFFADNLTAFNQQEEWKQFVSVLSYYLPNDDEENYNNMLSDTYEGLLNMGYENIDSVIEGLADDITDKANAGDMTINTDTVTQYVKELYGNEDSYDYILDGVLKTLSITESKKTEAKGESERGYITGEVEAIIDGMTDLDKSKITGKLIDDVVDIVSDGDVSVDSPEFDERVTSVVLNMLDESKTMKTESASADVIEYFGMQDNTDEEYKNNVAKEYKTLRAKYPDKEMILNGDFGTYLGTEKATPVEKGKYITVYESKKVTEAEVATATKSAGEYWVGDPCYVLPDEVYFGIWDKQYKFNDGTIDCGNGLSFQVHGTAWGDGEYKGSNGFIYGVDAGVLAIVPMELATKEIGLTLGTRHKSSTAKLEYNDGVFNMIFDTETITIDTDPSDNDLDESKQLKKEEYEVRQDYYDPETGEATRNEYVQSFDTWEEAQRFADGLAQDPNCRAWVNDTSKDESRKIEDKKLLAEDTDEIPVVNPDEQDYYDNKGYIISLYPRSRSNVSII